VNDAARCDVTTNYAQISKIIFGPQVRTSNRKEFINGFKLGEIEQTNQNVEEWLRNRKASTPPSKPKKQVKTIGDAVLELQHFKGKRRTKAIKELLRNKRLRELVKTKKAKT
jgi:hypothetical protein